ncbi:MAG: T9SS type A sorting domain-containing protein [Saprospiraceae bacterium]|nr:T9SS type A sorting domain-containing protein [Candidatus Defluviibacterium haderslevense]
MIKRYHKDGSIDESFGQDGKEITDFGNADDEAKALALQSDDKTIVAGISFKAGVTDFAVARYNNMITSTKKVGDKKNQISVFPNPTSKYLNISLNNDDHFNFEIINAVGVLVMKGKNTQQIDVSNLKEGPYFLSIRYKHNVYCQKWIKLGAK